jgi:hypothetical protein
MVVVALNECYYWFSQSFEESKRMMPATLEGLPMVMSLAA